MGGRIAVRSGSGRAKPLLALTKASGEGALRAPSPDIYSADRPVAPAGMPVIVPVGTSEPSNRSR